MDAAAADRTDMVSELDPDAKTRLRKQLHDCDEKDEQRLIRWGGRLTFLSWVSEKLLLYCSGVHDSYS